MEEMVRMNLNLQIPVKSHWLFQMQEEVVDAPFLPGQKNQY